MRLHAEDVDWVWEENWPKTNGPRSQSMASAKLILTHKTNKQQVSGEIKPGKYTKSEMQQKKRALFEDLMEKLEEQVL